MAKKRSTDGALPGTAEPQLGEDSVRAELGLGTPGKGWYHRGLLPHADFPGSTQSITYRLADSLPADAVHAMERELAALPPDRQDKERRKRIEALLERGYGCCALRDPQIARCVVETWQRFVPQRYNLLAWVVMPNHVHVLVHIREGWELGTILQPWKSFTGRRLRAGYGVGWLRDYWDRYIRDERHLASTVAYIHNNPVKAGLVRRAEDWPWSSAGIISETAQPRTAEPGTAEPQLGEESIRAELGLGTPGEGAPREGDTAAE
jgi:type I restriction enzyme R subunit/putative DNA methylase